MSYFRVCLIDLDDSKIINFVKFDNKEDAEHYAKNKSAEDSKHAYEVQKNDSGEFVKIKSYLNGQED